MDDRTAELRDSHDALAAFYREHLDGLLDRTPVERSVLGLFAELTRSVGSEVGDIGCGTGRLAPFLLGAGLQPTGVDLSPEMVRVAREDHPGVSFEVGDLRALPFDTAALAGVVCWYSLLFLAPDDRPTAFEELARVVRPGGHLVTALKDGDGTHQRRGRGTGLDIEFDAWWLSSAEMEERLITAGFSIVFRGGRPAEEGESTPQGYLVARRTTADICLASYGTLAPGKPNHHQMDGLAGRWIPGTVRGHLHEAGWGAHLGFPALVLDPAGSLVGVQVLESADLPAHWDRLDEFEGVGYERVTTTVQTAAGPMRAGIYVLRPVAD